jgi:hypothetical protein
MVRLHEEVRAILNAVWHPRVLREIGPIGNQHGDVVDGGLDHAVVALGEPYAILNCLFNGRTGRDFRVDDYAHFVFFLLFMFQI